MRLRQPLKGWWTVVSDASLGWRAVATNVRHPDVLGLLVVRRLPHVAQILEHAHQQELQLSVHGRPVTILQCGSHAHRKIDDVRQGAAVLNRAQGVAQHVQQHVLAALEQRQLEHCLHL